MPTLNLGILAHVDAGKTTLTERLLYAVGVIDEIGSVDDGTTQTDSLALERQRGITIKSAVVSFVIDDVTVNLIDTPGHPDFIAEVERVLSVLDGAVLIVSAVEGVQAQTRVLMRALQRLRVPTLFFVNKIDRAGAGYERVLRNISAKLTPAVTPPGSGQPPGDSCSRVRPVGIARRCRHLAVGGSACRTQRRSTGCLRRRRDGYLVAPTPQRAGDTDQAGTCASGVLRLGHHRCGPGFADRWNPRALGHGRRGLRRTGVRHRLQDRTGPSRREGRLRSPVLRNLANAGSPAMWPGQ